MKALQKITINGKERNAILTLCLPAHAEKHNIDLKIPTHKMLSENPIAWLDSCVNAIYAGLLVGCEREGVQPDFAKYDIEAWATENESEFILIASELTQMFEFVLAIK